MKDKVLPSITKVSLNKQRKASNSDNDNNELLYTAIPTESNLNCHTSHKECLEAIKIINALLKSKGKMTQMNNQLKQDLITEKKKVSQLELDFKKLKEENQPNQPQNQSKLINNHNDEEVIKLKAKFGELTQNYHSLYEENLKLKEKVYDFEIKLREIPQAKIEIKGTNSLLKEIIRLKREIENSTSYKNTQRHLDQTVYTLENENKALKNQIAELKSQKMLIEMKSKSFSSSVKISSRNALNTEQSEKNNHHSKQSAIDHCESTQVNSNSSEKNFFEAFFDNEEKAAMKCAFNSEEKQSKYYLFKKKINCLVKARNIVEQKYKYENSQMMDKLNDLNSQIDFLNNKKKTIELKYKLLLQKNK